MCPIKFEKNTILNWDVISETENPMGGFKRKVDIGEDRIGKPEDRPKEIPNVA